MSSWKKIKSFWKKFKKSIFFLFFFGAGYGACGKLLADYISSERGVEMTNKYFVIFAGYYSYFVWIVYFLLILGGFYLGYLLSKSRNRALREDELDNQKNNLEEIHFI